MSSVTNRIKDYIEKSVLKHVDAISDVVKSIRSRKSQRCVYRPPHWTM